MSSKFSVRAMQADEIHEVGRGCQRAFGDTVDWHGWTVNYPHRPHYTPAMHRVGVLNGKIIAHALVESYTLRYGGARLRVAGIGKVYTDREHRGKGYGAAVLRDALAYAIEGGSHLALLNGIRGYYTRFGFYPVFPRYYAGFNALEASQLQSPLSLRDPQPYEIPILAGLFERHWRGRVTFVRPPETWIWRVLEGDDGRQVWVVAEGEQTPQGYVAGYSLTDDTVELVVNTAPAALLLLKICGHIALESGRTHFRWLMPPDDALIAFAQETLPIALSAEYEPDGGWMARVVDAKGLLDALSEELIAQAQTTLGDARMMLKFSAEGFEIGIRGQSVRVILSQRDFIQLLFGSLGASTLGLRDSLPYEAVQLLAALFPPRVAALGAWDWF
jgi:predicted N-acetyltransferase YhbS